MRAKPRAQEPNIAMAMLKMDHRTVAGLFERLEKAATRPEKARLIDDLIRELRIHCAVEEGIFYPAVRREMKDESGIMERADEEHHEIKLLLAELSMMTGAED